MSAVLLVAVLGGAVTYAARSSFLLVAERLVRLPRPVAEALRMIPPAALAALTLPALARPDGPVELLSPELLGGALATWVAWRFRSLGLTLAVGLVAITLLGLV